MASDRHQERRLESGQVDVWLTPLSVITDDLQRAYRCLLSEPESAHWRRFAVPGPRLQYLVSRALVRISLSRYADVSEQQWQFETNPYGRPFISQPASFRHVLFNVSHTDGLVACAVSKDCDIGIDVESIRRDIDMAALAPSVFSPMELASLNRSPLDERRERFFSYWTLKEAYVKARGMGLSLALDGFWFDLDASPPRVHFTERCPDDQQRWSFREYRPTPDHKLAVAISAPGREPTIRVRWIVPLLSPADMETYEPVP